MYWAIIGLGAFVAIWMLFVVPAERRHHERKLEIIQKKLEKRQAQNSQEVDEPSTGQDDDIKDS